MNNTNVFISAGTPFTDTQEAFLSSIEERLRAENFNPFTVGRTAFTADSPLKTVITCIDECFGTIVVALERSYVETGTEKKGSTSEKVLNEVKYATPWNHIEAAIAYSKGHPIFAIVEEGIKTEGLLEKGYDWYVMSVKPEVTALNSKEFNGVLASWKKKVEQYQAEKAVHHSDGKKIDSASLTIGDLLKGLKPSGLWAIFIALAAVASLSFAVGKFIGASDAKSVKSPSTAQYK